MHKYFSPHKAHYKKSLSDWHFLDGSAHCVLRVCCYIRRFVHICCLFWIQWSWEDCTIGRSINFSLESSILTFNEPSLVQVRLLHVIHCVNSVSLEASSRYWGFSQTNNIIMWWFPKKLRSPLPIWMQLLNCSETLHGSSSSPNSKISKLSRRNQIGIIFQFSPHTPAMYGYSLWYIWQPKHLLRQWQLTLRVYSLSRLMVIAVYWYHER